MSGPALFDWVEWSRHGQPPLALAQRDPRRPPRSWAERVRDLLQPPEPLPEHVGLFLDRCLFEPSSGQTADAEKEGYEHPGRQALYRAAVASLSPGTQAFLSYREVFARWQALLAVPQRGLLRRTVTVTAQSRILLHPETAGTVTESALLLHHTYGVPYLPGSALRGLCRAWLAPVLAARREGPQVADLFGDPPSREGEAGRGGLIDFWDALWIPPSQDGDFSPLMVDVVNPHHPEYYTKQDHPAPAPYDDPQPTHFLTVSPGSRFLVAVEASDSEGGLLSGWLDFVVAQLLMALSEIGIGAKTSAGYGRAAAPDRPQPARGGQAPRGQAAPAASPAPRAPVPARTEGLAHLSHSKGDGTLQARLLVGGAVARASGALALALYQGLAEETRRRLDKGKEVRVRVVVEQDGNQRRLVAISES